MLEKFILNRTPPERQYIASCMEFKERQEFCKNILIPLLLKRNINNLNNANHENKIITKDNNQKSKIISNKNNAKLRVLINKIRKEAINYYTEINKNEKCANKIEFKLIIDKLREIITNYENELKNKIITIENKIEDYKLKYMEKIILNEKNIDLITVQINELLCKISKLNFSNNSLIEKIDQIKIEKYGILSIIHNNISDFYILVAKLDEIYNKLNNINLKCSDVYDIINTLSGYSSYYYNNENNIDTINIGSKVHEKILEIIHFIETLLSRKFLNILKLYCNWGKIDKIVEFISKNNATYCSNANYFIEQSVNLTEIERKEKIVKSLGIILTLLFECNGIYNHKLLKYDIMNKIISYLCDEIINTLKSLFFSKKSLLSNIDKPEWFLQTTLSIYKSHDYYLNELWKQFKDNIKKEIYLLENYGFDEKNKDIKNNFIPYYIPKNKYISLINEILSIKPKVALSISILDGLRSMIRIYIKKTLLLKDDNVIRDNKSDYLFERLVEQILVQYKYWKEIDEYNCIILLLDLLTNINIKDLIKINNETKNKYLLDNISHNKETIDNININLGLDDDEYEHRIVNVEDITKTAMSLAKIALSATVKDKGEKYFNIIKEGRPSEFPSEYGVLNWFCILNKIYIKNQTSYYLNDSLVSCYTDKFNVKRTVKDLFETLCMHSGSSDRNAVLKWFSEKIIYMDNNNINSNIQPLITPIKSVNINEDVKSNSSDLILILGYSIETIELLNAFSGKILLFIESCLSIENITTKKLIYSDKYYDISNYLKENIDSDCSPSAIFVNEFSIPIIDNCMVSGFISYINSEWDRIGRKIGPFLPISSILIESVNLVLLALVNLNDAICIKDSNTADTYSGNDSYILSLYKDSIHNLKKTMNDMIEDVRFEIREVLIKPLLFGEIKIPSLNSLIDLNTNYNLSSFSTDNARLLFDEHLSNKANELKYSFKLFNIFLSKYCLDEISKVLSE
ncbi:hypothetical protein FG386_001938 [Cryptosporidium ryanae]|uniref:uncharacterized protein n=1 Tax=Cryptosporidium ryanae TaxID=515981 RepID=UPI00351A7163|nr:hypothetical protein FG386_001938 [Cryptosporidium ryanae]